MIKIIIADDHQMFLEGLVALFTETEDIKIIGTAVDGDGALQLLATEEIDIVISDISMPGIDGIELNSRIKKKYPNVKTLILSTFSEPEKIKKLVNNKVNGYLLKNAEKSELLNAIYTIHKGENYFSEEVKDKYTNSFFSTEKNTSVTPVLSRREKEILKHIAEEYTTPEIADKLCISQNTVNTHRKNLISKLGVKSVAGLVKYAMNNGLA